MSRYTILARFTCLLHKHRNHFRSLAQRPLNLIKPFLILFRYRTLKTEQIYLHYIWQWRSVALHGPCIIQSFASIEKKCHTSWFPHVSHASFTNISSFTFTCSATPELIKPFLILRSSLYKFFVRPRHPFISSVQTISKYFYSFSGSHSLFHISVYIHILYLILCFKNDFQIPVLPDILNLSFPLCYLYFHCYAKS